MLYTVFAHSYKKYTYTYTYIHCHPTSGVCVREAWLYSLSLELLSDSSVSDSELLSDSLLLPDAPLGKKKKTDRVKEG